MVIKLNKLKSYGFAQNRILMKTNQPWENIKKPCSLCVWKRDTHARHQRGMKYHGSNFIAGCQINCRDSSNTLTVQYDVFWAYAIS